ncbi:hypothetical protein Pelo_2367 [Pelomyxa schiedti]|nr:hypothetical protein Pelo_2367 [Pelomyxa schiedti]
MFRLHAPLFHPSLETHSVGISATFSACKIWISKMHSCAVPFHPTQATCSISEARLISELLLLCGASDEKSSLLYTGSVFCLSTAGTPVGTPNSAQQVSHAQGTLLKFCLLRQAGGCFSDSKRLTTRH